MKKQTTLPRIGIIGGAGPMAGLQMVKEIIHLCQTKYGCQADADFPYIMLLSYPFADMMTLAKGQAQRSVVEKQVQECFDTFSKHDVSIAAIACNTLHEFLSSLNTRNIDFLHMIKETSSYLIEHNISKSLVLCTQTSALSNLHSKHFPCIYPDPSFQKTVDDIIQNILAGRHLAEDSRKLAEYANQFASKSEPLGVILGCTELPLLNTDFPLIKHGLKNSVVIDPMTLLAEKICKKVF